MTHAKLVTSFFLLASLACTEETDVIHHADWAEGSTEWQSDREVLLKEFTVTLARSLEDKRVSTFVRRTFDTSTDAENSVPLSKLLYKGDGSEFNLQQELSRMRASRISRKSVVSESVPTQWLDDLEGHYPQLQLSVPVKLDLWDVDKYIPLVAFLPEDFDEQTSHEITAYDQFGQSHRVSTVEEPEMPVVIVWPFNEADQLERGANTVSLPVHVISFSDKIRPYSKNSSVSAEPMVPQNVLVEPEGSPGKFVVRWDEVQGAGYYQVTRMRQGESQFRWIADVRDGPPALEVWIAGGVQHSFKVRAVNEDGHGPWSYSASSFGSDRADGGPVILKRMKLDKVGLRYIESWVMGAPEVFVHIAVVTPEGASAIFTSRKLEPKTRDDIRDKWWTINELLLDEWTIASYGTALGIIFTERDPWGSTSMSVGTFFKDPTNSGRTEFGQAQLVLEGKHQQFGEEVLHWRQPLDFVYEQNGLSWEFSN